MVPHGFISQKLKKSQRRQNVCHSAQLLLPSFYDSALYPPWFHRDVASTKINQPWLSDLMWEIGFRSNREYMSEPQQGYARWPKRPNHRSSKQTTKHLWEHPCITYVSTKGGGRGSAKCLHLLTGGGG